MSHEGVRGRFDAIVHSESSWVVQAEAGLDVVLEVTVEGVKVLFQVHVEEGQCVLLVVQRHSDPHRVHRDPQIWTPAVV